MKTKRQILTGLCLILFIGSNAKTIGGIYMNAADFMNNKLTYETDCKKEPLKIHLNDFFGNSNSFTITHDGKKQKLQKNNVFGYRDCKDNVYRFYANAVYKIVDAGNIYIYSRERNVAETKGFVVVTDYFFSATPDGKIAPLNAANLVYAYCDDEKFLSQLENYQGDVTAYNGRHKTFVINYLFTKSLK